MKRTTPILVAILFLLAIGYYIFTQTQSVEDNIFHVENSADIARIEMEKIVKGESASTLLLERKGDDWTVDGQYPVLTPKIANFLKTLTQIRVKEPIEKGGQETALTLLKKNHTRVKVLDAEGEILVEYLVGPTDNAHHSNIMMVQGATQAYLVSKPGMEGYVSIYYTTDPIEWRDRAIFDMQGADVKRIQIDYLDPNAIGFDLRRDGDGSPWMVEEAVMAEPSRTEDYLRLFTGKVAAESFAGTTFPGMRDSLAKRDPDVRFQYETIGGESGKLLLFVRPENVNNYFGYLEGNPELFTVQRFVMDKFFKTKNYFLPSPS